MKIKSDFVSNSSSTSFVYIAEDEMTEEAFFEAIGVEKSSPVADLFSDMYYELKARMSFGETIDSEEDFKGLESRKEFLPEVLEKIKIAMEENKVVKTGSLSSDGAIAESVLCTEIFEIESDKMYVNAFNNYW